MTSDDIWWHLMTSYDIAWHHMTSSDIFKYWLIYAEVISPGIVIFRRSFTPHEIIFWGTWWNICRLRISRLHFSAAAITNKICGCQRHFLKNILRSIKNYWLAGWWRDTKFQNHCIYSRWPRLSTVCRIPYATMGMDTGTYHTTSTEFW